MNTKKGHIGILGLGSRSTLFYLKELNKQYHKKKGDFHTFPCVIFNVDFDTINSNLPNKFETLIPELDYHLKMCFQFEIAVCLIPNITLHETYDLGNLKYPIIHPVLLTIEYLKNNDIKQVTIFGSKYTMEADYLPLLLKAQHINVILPKAEDRTTIDSLRQKIYNSTETQKDIEAYRSLIDRYSQKSNVLVACTELSILHEEIHSSHVIDMALLQIDKAISPN